jgi:hypothetical protein
MVAAASFLAFLEPHREMRLVVSDGRGRPLGKLELPDSRFSHVFTHSVHLTPVEELYQVEDRGFLRRPILRLYELRYESLGVGMPEDAEGGYRLENGVFVLAMDRRILEIPLRVSIVPGHGIVAGGVYRPFRNWARPEEALVLSAEAFLSIKPRRSSP